MKIKINSFFSGILSLFFSQFLIKVFGIIYSLYLTNKPNFGDEGNAIYMSGYQIYALLLSLSSIGIPNAISKIISEMNSERDFRSSERTFKISILLFSFIGFLGCIVLFVFADFIANNILFIKEAKLSLLVLAPAIFFVSINSVIRGYFNGTNKIYVTAKSQFYEQVFKSIFTIIFVEFFSNRYKCNVEILAAIANFSTTCATFFSLVYMIYQYSKEKRILKENKKIFKGNFEIVKKILAISIPMTISAILSTSGKSIDSATVVRILKNYMNENEAKMKYGILSSKVDTLIALPLAFNIAISTTLIPEISRKKGENNLNDLVNKIELAIRITSIIAFPCVVGMMMYSKEIFYLLFPNALEGFELLSLASISIIFSMFTQTLNGILQGIGKNKIPVKIAIISTFLKIMANVVFIPIDGIYEKGAIIGNIIFSFNSCIIAFASVKKYILIKVDIFKVFIKPFIASIIMIFFSKKIYRYFILLNLNISICIIISLICAIIIYGICVIVMKMLNKNDCLSNH